MRHGTAYDEGYRDGLDVGDSDSNPYPDDTSDSAAYDAGVRDRLRDEEAAYQRSLREDE